jgi:hypothetical protein
VAAILQLVYMHILYIFATCFGIVHQAHTTLASGFYIYLVMVIVLVENSFQRIELNDMLWWFTELSDILSLDAFH